MTKTKTKTTTKTKTIEPHSSYRFVSMGSKPLAYPVKCNNRIVIPAGATGVKIAFRQSHLTYLDDYGKIQKMNVYLWHGRLYHA